MLAKQIFHSYDDAKNIHSQNNRSYTLAELYRDYPGRFRTFFRYLSPREKRYFLTISSGLEIDVLFYW